MIVIFYIQRLLDFNGIITNSKCH